MGSGIAAGDLLVLLLTMITITAGASDPHAARPAPAFLALGGEIWFSYSNVSDPAILREAGAKWAFQLVLAELKAANGMWKFAYRGTLR